VEAVVGTDVSLGIEEFVVLEVGIVLVLEVYECAGWKEERVSSMLCTCSVRRSSSLDRKYDQNRTEPNCKRPDHQLQLPAVGVSPVASCHVFGNI